MSDDKIRELTVDEVNEVSGGDLPWWTTHDGGAGIPSMGGGSDSGTRMPGQLQA
jgi:hypothetical protein